MNELILIKWSLSQQYRFAWISPRINTIRCENLLESTTLSCHSNQAPLIKPFGNNIAHSTQPLNAQVIGKPVWQINDYLTGERPLPVILAVCECQMTPCHSSSEHFAVSLLICLHFLAILGFLAFLLRWLNRFICLFQSGWQWQDARGKERIHSALILSSTSVAFDWLDTQCSQYSTTNKSCPRVQCKKVCSHNHDTGCLHINLRFFPKCCDIFIIFLVVRLLC